MIRYIRLLGGSFFGVTFRRILPAVLTLALVSWLTCIYEQAVTSPLRYRYITVALPLYLRAGRHITVTFLLQAAFADPALFNIRLPRCNRMQ